MVGVVGAGVGIGGVGIGAGAGAGARTGTVTVAEFQTFEEVASNCFLSGEEFICGFHILIPLELLKIIMSDVLDSID